MNTSARAALLACAIAAASLAQQSPRPAGHWDGTLNAPERETRVVIDLDRNQKGEWIGTFSLPDVATNDIPLRDITVQGAAVRFTVNGVPGDPKFDGKLSEDGNTFSGTFSSSGKEYPFELKRSGEAKVSLPAPSTPLSKEFEGEWQGTLHAEGSVLRLVIKLSRAADGIAVGTFLSPDQANAEIPITTITQKGRGLEFEIRSIGAAYKGALNAAGTEINGEWSQSGSTLPLAFVRP
jgi:hypothetical protein